VQEVPARYLVARIRHFVQEFGINAWELLANTPYTPADLDGRLSQPEVRVTLAEDLAVYRNAQRLSPDPSAAFSLGKSMRPGEHGILGHALISCSTVGEAFSLINEFVQLESPLLETHFSIEQDVVVIEARPAVKLDGLQIFATEELLAVWRYSELPVPGLVNYLSHVEVLYPEPPHGDVYREMFRAPVHFGAPRTAVHLSLSVLDQPIPFGDPEVAAILRERIENLLHHLQPGKAELEEIRRALMALPIRYWSVDRLASQLGWREGLIRKVLRDNGSSYKQLKLDVKFAMAMQYLGNPSLSIRQVTQLLDYSTPSNFIRFFKARTGLTPQEQRRQQLTARH